MAQAWNPEPRNFEGVNRLSSKTHTGPLRSEVDLLAEHFVRSSVRTTTTKIPQPCADEAFHLLPSVLNSLGAETSNPTQQATERGSAAPPTQGPGCVGAPGPLRVEAAGAGLLGRAECGCHGGQAGEGWYGLSNTACASCLSRRMEMATIRGVPGPRAQCPAPTGNSSAGYCWVPALLLPSVCHFPKVSGPPFLSLFLKREHKQGERQAEGKGEAGSH